MFFSFLVCLSQKHCGPYLKQTRSTPDEVDAYKAEFGFLGTALFAQVIKLRTQPALSGSQSSSSHHGRPSLNLSQVGTEDFISFINLYLFHLFVGSRTLRKANLITVLAKKPHGERTRKSFIFRFWKTTLGNDSRENPRSLAGTETPIHVALRQDSNRSLRGGRQGKKPLPTIPPKIEHVECWDSVSHK